MRWKTTVDSDAVDVDLLRAAVPLLLDRLRGLAVRDGLLVHPDTQTPMPALRVVSGSHPLPGTWYEAVETIERGVITDAGDGSVTVGAATIRADDPKGAAFLQGVERGGGSRTSVIELVDDNSRQFRLTGTERGGAIWVFTLGEPRRATRLTVEGVTKGGTSWATRGTLEVQCSIDLAALSASTVDGAAPVRWSIKHRRFRARGGVSVETTPSGWRLHLSLTARGRGVLIPFGVLFGWMARRALDHASMEHGFDELEPLIDAMRADPIPDALADHWLRELLEPYVDQR